MNDALVFNMGNYTARFPTDRSYARNHMWAIRRGDVYRCGFSDYAVRLLQDVYFLDWTVDTGSHLTCRQEIGAIESKKAESSLHAPMTGRLVNFNEILMRDPSAINVSPYDGGWLFEMAGEGLELLTPAEYVEHLHAVWEVTQRTIKGQLND